MLCKNYGAPLPEASKDREPLTLVQYLVLFLVFCTPFLNLVLLFKWAFSRRGNISRRNFSRAALVVFGAGVIIYILAFLYMTGISGH